MPHPESSVPLTDRYVFHCCPECRMGTCKHNTRPCPHVERDGLIYSHKEVYAYCTCFVEPTTLAKEEETKAELPVPLFVFEACQACKDNTCLASKMYGHPCTHKDRDGKDFFYQPKFLHCKCRTVEKSTILTDTAATKAFKHHDYSNKYMPSHCCACGEGRGNTRECVPIPFAEVVCRVEYHISTWWMPKKRTIEESVQIETVAPQLYRGNVSPIVPVSWSLIGGPLAQRKRNG